MIRKTAILVVVLLATFLCIVSLSLVSAQPCDYNVTVLGDTCCLTNETWGWFYNETGWNYSSAVHPDYTYLFHLRVVDDEDISYWAYCINYTAPLYMGDTFNTSIYSVAPTCKNNSIAYILNNWTYSCAHCENVSAGQSAIWYFWYINESFCLSDTTPTYNHTAKQGELGWESNWIPNCTAHSEACDLINASINESVPYNLTLTPNTGSYLQGTPIPLEAAVEYCGVEEVVTVVFETDAGNFSESGTKVHVNFTTNGKAGATLVCDAESANVTARVKDMKWFEIVDPIGCPGNEKDFQETLRIINVTDDANFTFSGEPSIKIVKLVNGVDTYIAIHGEMVTFTLNVTNTGNATLRDIMVNDTLPAKLTFINASPAQDSVAPNAGGTTTVIWKNKLPPALEPGNYTLIRFNATIDPDAESGKTYRNWVTVNATSDYGDVNASDYADVYLRRPSRVPVISPFGIAVLIGVVSLVAVLSISKKGKRG